MKNTAILGLFIFLFLISLNSFSQNISGTVKDKNGSPIADCRVTAHNRGDNYDSEETATVYTNTDGFFEIKINSFTSYLVIKKKGYLSGHKKIERVMKLTTFYKITLNKRLNF
jgi:hypothetical protein